MTVRHILHTYAVFVACCCVVFAGLALGAFMEWLW